MCLSKAFIEKNGQKEIVMSEIASVQVEDGKLILKSLFGEQKEITATIREIDFVGNGLRLDVSGR